MCKVEKSNLPPMAPVEPQATKPKFPHATRRKLIMAKYPEVKKLFGHCWKTKYVIAATVALQTYLALNAQYMSWPAYLLIMYCIGGTANHAMMMGMHEVSHNLGFKKPVHNKLLGIIANLPIGVPSSISFKRYHLEHHRYQGEDGVDVDLPTELEGKIFNNKLTKFLFVVFQLFFYGGRPLIVNPKVPGMWEFFNVVVCLCYNYAIYVYGGLSGLLYLLIGTVLGCGVHPVAGHFIAEHYEFHHDFPFVPGSRLHQVRALAPEFYNNLPSHKSWVKVQVDYIMDDNINAYSRVKRHNLTDDVKEKMKSD
ncbi:Sphingolipid delta4-desaturase, N-terminal [Phytophthora cactorum]|nr:Sphingolipid delta4-desaturase, N-terminal [Phytophthora cactorum]